MNKVYIIIVFIINITIMSSISIETNTILPPQVPTIEEETFISGSFDYIESFSTREILKNAYQAITLTETWGFVRKDIESFMMSNSPEIKIITKKMFELGYYGHSGFSFGWTMRQMQFIAKNGEQEYKKSYEENK
jgi:hypothetical protein